MSSKALVDTVSLELKQLAAQGEHAVLLTPGNYGKILQKNSLACPSKSRILLQFHRRRHRRGG
jgi:cobalamin biosynthesis protein CbiD